MPAEPENYLRLDRSRSRLVVWIATALLAISGVTGAQEAASESTTVTGKPWMGERGRQERGTQIMARDKFEARKPAKPLLHPLFRMERAPVPEPAGNVLSGGSAPFVATPLLAQTVSPTINFTAATKLDCSGWPPDTMGVAGPTQFIIALNGRIRSFNKAAGTNDAGINAGTDSFFSSVMTFNSNGNFTSDPRIRYDRLSGRWFITMIDVPGLQGTLPNRVMIAMSDSGTISANTGWTFFYFQADTVSGDTGDFADYDTLGIDANALYIGANMFNASGAFADTAIFVVRKSSLINGGPIVVTGFRGLINNVTGTGLYTPQGADNYDPAATEGYVVGVDAVSSTGSRVRLRRIGTPGATPTLSANTSITVTTYARPINVPHLGNTGGTPNYLDRVDHRLMAAHYRKGVLWTSHNVGVNNTGGTTSVTRDGVRWYAITNVATGSTPSIRQSGTVYQASANNTTDQRSYWMGTIVVSGQGHAAMGFSSAGQNEFANAATCGRLAGDTAGTMQTPVLYTASSSAYNAPYNRWGDYSFTSVDPSDDMTLWTVQEWCSSPGIYGVQVAKLLAPLPALPTTCSPGIATQGVASVTITLTGLAANGTGFFDPGAGFSNHISLAVNGGGVNVSSLTYNNPSNLTAVLSIAANAPAGPRTITVTNPDGQSATSASALLTIFTASNLPPTLAAIFNQTTAVGLTLSITNAASDSDGDVLTYSLGPGAATNATINATNGVFTWTPTQPQIGSNSFSVIVSDSGFPTLTATQRFSVIVIPSNNPPVLAAISNQFVAVGMSLILTNFASDLDSPPQVLTFSLVTTTATNATINPTNGHFAWTPNQSQLGTNNFTVTVTDNGLPPLSTSRPFFAVVVPSNNPPVLTAISNQLIAVGMSLILTNSATDPDSPPQVLTFSLATTTATNATVNPTNGIIAWTPNQSQLGTNNFTVTVTDNGLPPLSASQSFCVFVVPSNNPPVLAAISNQLIAVGMPLILTNAATDPDSPPQVLTFSLATATATNATINPSNGNFTWSPNQSQLGTNNFTVTVTDNGLPPLSASQSFSVVVVPSNNPPVLAAISNQLIAVGMSLILTNSANDPDSPPQVLTFSLATTTATNAIINSTNGAITWTPDQSQLGTNDFTLTVTDNGLPPLSESQSFSVVVMPSNNPPVLAPISDRTLYALSTLIVTNGATDPDSPPQILTFNLDLGAPVGTRIDSTNGILVWTPDDSQTGTNSITVRVTDNGFPNLSDSIALMVIVLPRPVLLSPIDSNGLVSLIWDTVSGMTYRVQFKTNLMDAAWTDLAPDVVAVGATSGFTQTNLNSTSFYRVLVVSPGP